VLIKYRSWEEKGSPTVIVEQRNIYSIYYSSTLTLPDTSGEGEVAVEVVVAVR